MLLNFCISKFIWREMWHLKVNKGIFEYISLYWSSIWKEILVLQQIQSLWLMPMKLSLRAQCPQGDKVINNISNIN